MKTLLFAPPLALLFAEMVVPDLSTIGKDLGVLSILAWFLYYNTTVAIPNLVKAFREESASLREFFRIEISSQRKQTDEIVNTLIQGYKPGGKFNTPRERTVRKPFQTPVTHQGDKLSAP